MERQGSGRRSIEKTGQAHSRLERGMLKAVSMTALRPSRVGWAALVAAPVLLAGAVRPMQRPVPDLAGTTGRVTLSIVGTTDLHRL